LRASVKDAKRVFADDTGWRINGEKCCYHIICSIDKVLEDKAGSARAFGETFKTLFKDAIALWQRYHVGGVDDYTREAQNIT